jgi:hypothetical protein
VPSVWIAMMYVSREMQVVAAAVPPRRGIKTAEKFIMGKRELKTGGTPDRRERNGGYNSREAGS